MGQDEAGFLQYIDGEALQPCKLLEGIVESSFLAASVPFHPV